MHLLAEQQKYRYSIIFNKLGASILIKILDHFWDNDKFLFSELTVSKISFKITISENNSSTFISIFLLLQKINTLFIMIEFVQVKTGRFATLYVVQILFYIIYMLMILGVPIL